MSWGSWGSWAGGWLWWRRQTAAGEMNVPVVSLIVFGSFARREADVDSDLDVLIVRPDAVEEADESWIESVERWCRDARLIAGNQVEVLEIDQSSTAGKFAGGTPLW